MSSSILPFSFEARFLPEPSAGLAARKPGWFSCLCFPVLGIWVLVFEGPLTSELSPTPKESTVFVIVEPVDVGMHMPQLTSGEGTIRRSRSPL